MAFDLTFVLYLGFNKVLTLFFIFLKFPFSRIFVGDIIDRGWKALLNNERPPSITLEAQGFCLEAGLS